MSTRTIFDGSKDSYIDSCYYRNNGKIAKIFFSYPIFIDKG